MPPRAATLPLLMVQGDWTEARDLALVTRADGSPLEQQMAAAILGNLARYQGDAEQAWAMVRELVPRGPVTAPGDGLFPYTVEMLRLAARLALDASDLREAREWLQAHDRWLDWGGVVRGRAEAHLLWARLHHLEGHRAQAERCAQQALTLAEDPRQPLALLAIHRFLGRIALDAKRYPDAQHQLTQALSLADACAAPYQRACTLIDLADLHVATGRAKDARPHLNEARDIAARLQAAPLVATADDLQTRLATGAETSNLTSRELDVLRLVAQGMTDAEVAEQLYISPRTVGQHLHSIYNKLGVSSRTAATRIAVEDRLV